jgi:GMP synthase-like glutamine amidotransferase
VGKVVLVYSEPFATRRELSFLEKIVKKKKDEKSLGFGYVSLAKTLNSSGLEYLPVLGNDYDGRYKDLVHIISGVDVKSDCSLVNENEVDKIAQDYIWVKEQYGVYGICFGYQILMVVNGQKIFKMDQKKNYSKFQLNKKSEKNNHLGKRNKKKYSVVVSHLDCGLFAPEGFRIESKRDNIIYKMVNWNMGHIGVQYHPEMNGQGKKEIVKDISNLLYIKEKYKL